MGKYFKEDNNQRTSSLKNINIDAIVEHSIRMAAGPKIKKIKIPPAMQAAMKQGAGKASGMLNTLWKNFGIRQTTTEAKPTLKQSELGYSNSSGTESVIPGTGAIGYAGGSFIPAVAALGKASAVIPKIGPIVSKFIQVADIVTALEQNFGHVGKLMKKEYKVIEVKNKKTQPFEIDLKTIINGYQSNGTVEIPGHKNVIFEENTINSIVQDMQKLDDYARKWARIKAFGLTGATAYAVGAVLIDNAQPINEQIRQYAELIGRGAAKPAPPSSSVKKEAPQTRPEFEAKAKDQLSKIMGKP